MFYSGIPGRELSDYEEFKALLSKDGTVFASVKAQAYKNLPVQLQDDIIVLVTSEDKVLLYHQGKNL